MEDVWMLLVISPDTGVGSVYGYLPKMGSFHIAIPYINSYKGRCLNDCIANYGRKGIAMAILRIERACVGLSRMPSVE